MGDVIDAGVLRAWVGLAEEMLGESREEIDRLNVFPVPDGDTGTNLYLTIEAAAEAAGSAHPASGPVELADGIAKGALMGARGNSGVIISQVLRGIADGFADAPADEPLGGSALAAALQRAADSAYAAVAVPREGTILTVARGAADGALAAGSHLPAVADASVAAAREALARTPDLLDVLREAGVVDAGGRGLVIVLDALARAVAGEQRDNRSPRNPVVMPSAHRPTVGYEGPEYEVMYLLDAPDDAGDGLRTQLKAIGDSVVVVGGRGLWNVHVHTDDIGAAIERAVDIGRPHRIRVTRLLEADALRVRGRGAATTRAVVVVAHGPDMADYLEEQGAWVVRARPRGRPSTAELLDAATASHAHDVVFLPSDSDTRPVAEAAAAAARDVGVRASVVPTRSIVQSLAALAVHDPDARFDADVIAMGRAAGAARYGGVTHAARASSTSAGPCKPGDVLGLVDGDIAVVGSTVGEVAQQVIERLMSRRTEIVTAVIGADAGEGEVAELEEWLAQARPDVDVDVLPGGQASWPFILGAE